jgi:iron complex outermembrane receptor protein
VAIYIDEVYVSAIAGATFQLFDLDRVEVLRGPQGTLFGRNASGGLAQFVSVAPGKEFEGYGSLTLGQNGQVKSELAVNMPISDRVSARSPSHRTNTRVMCTTACRASTIRTMPTATRVALQIAFDITDDLYLLDQGAVSERTIATVRGSTSRHNRAAASSANKNTKLPRTRTSGVPDLASTYSVTATPTATHGRATTIETGR